MGTWIDFKELRSRLKFAEVLKYYNVVVKAKGTQHHGFCPLPSHNGNKNSASFSANLEKNIFHCFGCQAKGNILEFAVMMENLSVEDNGALRATALKLRERFCPELGSPPAKREKPPKRVEAQQYELPTVAKDKLSVEVVINAPLDFELKNLDPKHPYLDKRGFTQETIRHFGLGFCAKGLLTGRIAIPLHDEYGRLMGYAGRIVDDKLINADNPKYRFPGKREHKRVTYEFHKLNLLYNSHRLKSPVNDLVIVEGFPSVWWLTQMGIPDVVAVMGSTMSEEQANIVCEIVPKDGRIWLMPDGNKAGRQCAQSMFEQLASKRFLHWSQLDEEKQPTDYPGGWLRQRMGR